MQSNFIEITLRHGCSPVNLIRRPTDGYFCLFLYPLKTSENYMFSDVFLRGIGGE